MSGVHVRGTAFLSTKQFLVEHYGADGFQQVMGRLQPEDRELVEQRLQTSNWYPFSTWIALCEAADEAHGSGDLSLCRKMGHYAGLKDLGTAYRQMFTQGDPLQIVRYAKQFWSLYYDSGAVEVENEGAGHFDLRIRDFGSPHLAHCLRVAGWIDASIELFKASGNVDIVSCRALGHPECRFRASWTMPQRKTIPPR
ncbi:MAG TPA: hypothetical protein VKN99_22065 [Polyangia bacterium]|nr:hypothetical protein [Polyangia bacterium]